ncbi:MAG: ATP-binding protein [Dehalococcoidia bacterium]
MEKIEDILKRLDLPKSTSEGSTDTWSKETFPEEGPKTEVCSLCDGAGWVTLDVPLDHPEFGKAVPCRCTLEKWEGQKTDRLRRYSNLGPLARLTFDNLLPHGRSTDPENQRLFSKAFEAARAYADDPQGWLVLVGASGSGKTHLAAAIANSCIERGHRVFFVVAPDLLDHLRATFAPSSDTSYDELFEQVRNVPILVLDDLGTQTSSPWAAEKLFQVLNHRFNSQLPTVVTTNVSLEQLDENLHSRLTDPALSRVYVVEKHSSILIGLDSLGLPLPAGMTFETFDPRGLNLKGEERRNLEDAFRLARSYAESPDGWLVLTGLQGCGKTHLAAAIAHYQRQKGTEVLFMLVPDLLDYLRSTYAPDSRITYDEMFNKVKMVPLLVLDDFGEQATTPWAREKLYQIINYRYNGRLPTVVTSSLALDEIDPRISSRMADPALSTVFAIIAPDYRSGPRPKERVVRSPERRRRSR